VPTIEWLMVEAAFADLDSALVSPGNRATIPSCSREPHLVVVGSANQASSSPFSGGATIVLGPTIDTSLRPSTSSGVAKTAWGHLQNRLLVVRRVSGEYSPVDPQLGEDKLPFRRGLRFDAS